MSKQRPNERPIPRALAYIPSTPEQIKLFQKELERSRGHEIGFNMAKRLVLEWDELYLKTWESFVKKKNKILDHVYGTDSEKLKAMAQRGPEGYSEFSIIDFQTLWTDSFGEYISRAKALQEIKELMELVRIVYKIPEN